MFGFEVIREEGSELIRQHVLLKALETERQNHNERESGKVELSRANYDFEVRGATGDMVKIGLMTYDYTMINGRPVDGQSTARSAWTGDKRHGNPP